MRDLLEDADSFDLDLFPVLVFGYSQPGHFLRRRPCSGSTIAIMQKNQPGSAVKQTAELRLIGSLISETGQKENYHLMKKGRQNGGPYLAIDLVLLKIRAKRIKVTILPVMAISSNERQIPTTAFTVYKPADI